MAKQTINIGSSANDGTGSTLRAGGDLINDNFNEIYTAFGDGSTLTSGFVTASSTNTFTNKTLDLGGTGNSNTFNSTMLYIDGAQVSSSNDRSYRNLDDPEAGVYHALSSSFLISLNANQTVNPMLQASGDTSITVRIGARFSGFLIA